MAMNFSFHDNLGFGHSENLFDFVSSPKKYQVDEVHLFPEKMEVPKPDKYIQRLRLDEILSKCAAKFGTIFINGRAGTGKTALASHFSLRYQKVSWLTIDSADSNWKIFSRYFSTSLENPLNFKKKFNLQISAPLSNPSELSRFIENKLAEISSQLASGSRLIVLDDVHHIFDADWFEDFFTSLICLLPPDIHLLILARGTPALPLWRLRSKQVLGVIDERLLAFNYDETAELFAGFGRSNENVSEALIKSYGRISRLKNIVETV